MTRRFAIYARVSNEESRVNQSSSIINQVDFIGDFLLTKGIRDYTVYVDDGFTGGNLKRPGIKRLIKDIQNKEIDTLVVKDLSRIGRNYIEVGKFIDIMMPMYGVKLLSINDNYDSTISNNDTIKIKNYLNDLYLRECKEKAKNTFSFSKKEVQQVIYGFTLDKEGRIVIDVESSRTVKKIFELYESGYSIEGIKEYLLNNKVTRPCCSVANIKIKEKEKKIISNESFAYSWSKSTIKKILCDYRYTGFALNKPFSDKLSNNALSNIDNMPCIITKEQYFLCEKIRRKNARNKKRQNYSSLNVFCKNCGGRLSFYAKYGKKDNGAVYRCKRCMHSVKEVSIQSVIIEDIFQMLTKLAEKKCMTGTSSIKQEMISFMDKCLEKNESFMEFSDKAIKVMHDYEIYYKKIIGEKSKIIINKALNKILTSFISHLEINWCRKKEMKYLIYYDKK